MTLFEQQQARRAALVERLSVIADLTCASPLPGELGDVAYDLLRQAAAQIGSDRLQIARSAGGVAATFNLDGIKKLWRTGVETGRILERYDRQFPTEGKNP